MNVWETIWNDLHTDIASPKQWYSVLILGLLLLTAAWATSLVVRRTADRILRRDKDNLLDRTSFLFFTQMARLGVYLLFGILFLHMVPVLRSLGTALLASVSVISVVVGLAAQSALTNLIAGLALVIYRPFEIGDVLRVATPGGSEEGMVESLNLGFTTLRMQDDRLIVVPNSQMNTQTFLRRGAPSHRPAQPQSQLPAQAQQPVTPGSKK